MTLFNLFNILFKTSTSEYSSKTWYERNIKNVIEYSLNVI
jgi:hypothetical protein